MAKKGGWDLDDHRRFAQQYLPPDEFRDGYLGYLDELELKEPAEQARGAGSETPPGPSEGARSRAGAGGRAWPVERYVVAAVGSVAFAVGAWILTSML